MIAGSVDRRPPTVIVRAMPFELPPPPDARDAQSSIVVHHPPPSRKRMRGADEESTRVNMAGGDPSRHFAPWRSAKACGRMVRFRGGAVPSTASDSSSSNRQSGEVSGMAWKRARRAGVEKL